MVGTLINLLKLDFKRAIYNKRFLIVVLIGVLLSVAHFFMEVFPMINVYEGGSAIFNPFFTSYPSRIIPRITPLMSVFTGVPSIYASISHASTISPICLKMCNFPVAGA